jgi:hypothetical protein
MHRPARGSPISRATASLELLGLPQQKVHGIWVPGPGCYGRNNAGDPGTETGPGVSKCPFADLRIRD